MEAIGTAFAAETNRRDEDTEMFVSIHIADSYLIVIENWCKKPHERLSFLPIIY